MIVADGSRYHQIVGYDESRIKTPVLSIRGFAKNKKFKKSEITMEVGGWVQVSL